MKMKRSSFESKKPNADDEDETLENMKAAPSTTMRVCEFCGKKFGSGKALGGHKRFHLQAQRKEKELAAAMVVTANNGDKKSGERLSSSPLICSLCNKDFPSEKSLFGHMRSHPDREWRGAHPPNSHSDDDASGNSIDRNDDTLISDLVNTSVARPAIDVSKSLPPTWLKTNVRGRESIYNALARALVSLVEHKNQDSANLPRDNNEEDTDDDKDEEEGEVNLDNGMNINEDHHKVSQIDEGVVVKMEESTKKRKLIVKFKTNTTQKHSKCEDDDDERVTKTLKTKDNCYQCSNCDKSFPTFQALGGHRSTHSKEKNKGNPIDKQKGHSGNDNNIGESSTQSSSKRTPWNFDLNHEPPNDSEDQEN